MGFMDIIPAIAGIGQTLIESQTAKRNTDRTILANKEMAEYAYSKDLEMWNRQNEYNSPEAQMNRLQGAGLNPNLVYGGGAGGASGQASQMPKYNAPTAQYNYRPEINLPQMLSLYQDFQMKQAQTDNIKAQTNYAIERTNNESLRAALIGIQTDAGRIGIEKTRQDIDFGRFQLDRAGAMLPYELEALGLENRSLDLRNQKDIEMLLTMPIERAGKTLENLRTKQQLDLGANELSLFGQRKRELELSNKLKSLDVSQKSWELLRRNPAELKKLQEEIEVKAAEKLWKQEENRWRQMGIQSSDSLPFRVLTRMYLQAMGMFGF